MSDIILNINPVYFWDVNIAELDILKSKRIIIERVCTLGNLNEIKFILNVYGKNEVEKELCKLNYLDNKTLHFFSIILNIPKNNFKCYKNRQLKNQHWS